MHFSHLAPQNGRYHNFTMKRYLLRLSLTSVYIWLLVAAQLSGIPAYAQGKLADIHGVARLGGVPLSEVSIVVRSLSGNNARVILSGVDGSFRVDKLNPGRYELTARMAD